MRFYPRAVEGRKSIRDPTVHKSRLTVLKTIGVTALLLNLLFLALFSYIFGAIYKETSHVHNLNVVFVDYDHSLIGNSFRQAYLQQLQGDSFPSIIEQSILEYPEPALLESAVCRIDYWAALYVSPNATARLASALQGASAALSYNRSDIVTMIWNEARYSAVVDLIPTALGTLSEAARIMYSGLNGTGAIQTMDTTNPAAVAAFTNPWDLVSINIQPTTQGSRLIYNTVLIIMILLQQFFFLATMNGVASQSLLFTYVHPRVIILTRCLISVTYTLGGSLCASGAVWAFRGDWGVNGNQWALTWLSLWLFAHVNLITFDVFTAWVPAPYLPMALVTWVILNVTSILLPFELTPAFYKWSYMMPAHAVYQLLIDIWSSGCNPLVAYALPLLFGFEISSNVLCSIGVYRRCHYAAIANEQLESSFKKKLDDELAKYMEKRETKTMKLTNDDSQVGEASEAARDRRRSPDVVEEEDHEGPAESIMRSISSLRREPNLSTRSNSLRPAFEIPFVEDV
ncbi:uncharacterized protein BHQ10_003604 [Talaromyces amestolkiae]|uniref:DUF3533 domain-containing protein n=1 Tax=Talaromyces amestolkiae TaxID=1196081 RepID=A0A364KVK9_TALAM|nr:uncharacterized protein BHQ10_003604 [Talaromyces amestolkiae]RAO67592.1 hypothetical protein BHQ10_003604 [Talaromyces amestolkiae]